MGNVGGTKVRRKGPRERTITHQQGHDAVKGTVEREQSERPRGKGAGANGSDGAGPLTSRQNNKRGNSKSKGTRESKLKGGGKLVRKATKKEEKN